MRRLACAIWPTTTRCRWEMFGGSAFGRWGVIAPSTCKVWSCAESRRPGHEVLRGTSKGLLVCGLGGFAFPWKEPAVSYKACFPGLHRRAGPWMSNAVRACDKYDNPRADSPLVLFRCRSSSSKSSCTVASHPYCRWRQATIPMTSDTPLWPLGT